MLLKHTPLKSVIYKTKYLSHKYHETLIKSTDQILSFSCVYGSMEMFGLLEIQKEKEKEIEKEKEKEEEKALERY